MSYKVKNALTFDIEEYFQVSNFEKVISRSDWDKLESRVSIGVNKILDILDKKNVKATFFVLGWVAERNPALIKKIADKGNEIATHGYEHKLIYSQTKEEFEQDLVKSKKILEDICGTEILGYRAPSFSITEQSFWALDILAKHNMRYDASIFPIVHHRYGMKNSQRFPYRINCNGSSILEYPCSTAKVMVMNIPFSGGSYLRLLPYFLVKNCIQNINKEGKPVIVYIHPWELDPEMPRIKAGFLNEFRHYNNLKTTELKLKRLLEDFYFTSVKDALEI